MLSLDAAMQRIFVLASEVKPSYIDKGKVVDKRL